MANLSKDIQCAGFDTRPPMLDRSDFESWQQRIRLYCLGKENGEKILQSIDEGPFKVGKFRETLAEGSLHLGLPKDIYTFVNHYTDAKDIWDNAKMLLEGYELTKYERESQLYENFEYFHQNKGETMHGYYVREDITEVKETMQGEQLQLEIGDFKTELGMKILENRVILDEEQLLFITGGQTNTFDDDVDEAPVQHLALNEDNIFQVDQCDAFDSNVDEAPTEQTMFMANLSLAKPIYDEAMIQTFYMSNIIPYDQYVKNNAEQVTQSNISFVPNDALMMIINDMHDQATQCVFANEHNKVVNESLTAKLARHKEQVAIYEKKASVMNENIVSRFFELHDAYTIGQASCLELEAKISKLKHKIEKDDHSEMIKRFSNLKDAPEFDSFFEINKVKEQLQGKNNTIRQLKEQISHMTERRSETSSLLNENEKLKDQLKGKMKCVTMDTVKPKVLAPGMYAIDVEPIPPRNRNNREVHLEYLKHLKESVETVHEIVKEARIKKPLDNALESTCLYTKRSQELLEYVIGTCPKEFSKREKKVATTHLNRKKQVTFKEPCKIANNNTQTHVKQQKVQKTNVHVILSIGVNSSTKASGSKPRSNTKNNMILQAKNDNNKKVEAHPKNNKSNLKQNNHVDSSISSKRTVVHLVFWYLDSGCSKHMTVNRSWLKNFMKKFIGTVRFKNDHFGAIMGYEDYVIGDNVISKSIDVVDLLKGSHGLNLYIVSVEDMMKSSLICLLSKPSKNKSWLCHLWLNHLNFGSINDLARKDLVKGFPRFKFKKYHLCFACELGKSKKYTHQPKFENTIMEVLHTLHMDLCRPMRMQSINRKKYILVIVDDYSRFTWVKFLRSKDETPEFVIKFLKQIQLGLNKTIRYIRIDNGTEFVN
uniref:Integrase catalytic domain-containing protein n=1 Tax=Tanacetum cinerariifolium TaxID=118510 RepID=A0A699GM11_TANCI|nr:hypothetical protein [Tanacetum cinerariifolium]